jgi:non-specific serine/threonine protein kinase
LRFVAVDPPPELRVLALRNLFLCAVVLDELDEAERYAEERRELCLALGDARGALRALQNFGIVADLSGDLDRAKAIYEEVLESAREDNGDVGIPLQNLASVAWKQRRLNDAEALYRESLAYYKAIGDEAEVAYGSTNLGGVLLYQDRRDEALPLLKRGLRVYRRLRYPHGLARAFAVTACASADEHAAAQLLGKADALYEEIGERGRHAPAGPYERAVASATQALGQEAFDAARAEGRAMSLDDAIALANEVIDAG